MRINELIIEITRRCNVQCRHCLRGKAQDKDIDNITIDRLLEGVTSIGTITFSGGEPSLAVDRIEYFTSKVKKLGIPVDTFYVVTNGKIASLKLALALLKLHAYCENKGDLEYIGGLIISQDQYHKELIKNIKPAKDLYGAFTFFKPDARNKPIEYPIDEGLAFDNGIGIRNSDANDLIVEVDDDGDVESIDGSVYVNALGEVCPSCDLSYESQEEQKIGSVHKNTIPEILKNYNRILEAA